MAPLTDKLAVLGRELGVSRNDGNWDLKLFVLRPCHSKPEAAAFRFMDYYNRHAYIQQGVLEFPPIQIFQLMLQMFFFHFCDRSTA